MSSCQVLPSHQKFILHLHPTLPFPYNSLKHNRILWHTISHYHAIRTGYPPNYNWSLPCPTMPSEISLTYSEIQNLVVLLWTPLIPMTARLSPRSNSYSCLPKKCKRQWQLPCQHEACSLLMLGKGFTKLQDRKHIQNLRKTPSINQVNALCMTRIHLFLTMLQKSPYFHQFLDQSS